MYRLVNSRTSERARSHAHCQDRETPYVPCMSKIERMTRKLISYRQNNNRGHGSPRVITERKRAFLWSSCNAVMA